MSVYVRIPRRPNKGYKWNRYHTLYTWEIYLCSHEWTCHEYYLEFEYDMYEAVYGEPQYDRYLGTTWMDTPFYEYDGGTTYYVYTGNSRPKDDGSTYSVTSPYRDGYTDGYNEPDTGHIYEYTYIGVSQGFPTNFPPETVTSLEADTYPQSGAQGDLWYEFISEENSGLGETLITDKDPNAYPENGKHTDGYWYVKV